MHHALDAGAQRLLHDIARAVDIGGKDFVRIARPQPIIGGDMKNIANALDRAGDRFSVTEIALDKLQVEIPRDESEDCSAAPARAPESRPRSRCAPPPNRRIRWLPSAVFVQLGAWRNRVGYATVTRSRVGLSSSMNPPSSGELLRVAGFGDRCGTRQGNRTFLPSYKRITAPRVLTWIDRARTSAGVLRVGEIDGRSRRGGRSNVCH